MNIFTIAVPHATAEKHVGQYIAHERPDGRLDLFPSDRRDYDDKVQQRSF
ncbi:hypothetical protein [Bifidobacterium sp. SO4]|nr:hypothetical protein [Bifidobacterium sp. SO4]MBT1171227.1 hypothetical protein [Bifidobacterium sp. SO4]